MLVKNKNRKRSEVRRPRQARHIDLSSASLVETDRVSEQHDMPLVIKPKLDGVSLSNWIVDNATKLEELLHIHAAVLFRGFDMETDQDFVDLMESLPFERMPYFEGSTPRKTVGKMVYTSTEYPSDETIALHSEYSSSTKFPRKVWFYCETPPVTGGETPIGDARKLLARIDPEVRDKFRRLGWCLVRNYGDGLGLPWRRAFAMDDPAQLEAYCRSVDIEVRWKDDSKDRLWTRQVRSAIIEHPVTGEEAWFNHMAFWHTANLSPEVYREMVDHVGEENLPYRTMFGDGTPIPDDVANHIRDCYKAEKVKFPWQKGDVLLIDNILSLHGREPFDCQRRIRVAISQPYFRPAFSPAVEATVNV